MNNKNLSERDICTKFITPALTSAGWDVQTQVREEVTFTAGRIIVRGNLHSRGKTKRADDLLYYRPNLPIAVILKKTFCNLLFPLRTTSAACGDGMLKSRSATQSLRRPSTGRLAPTDRATSHPAISAVAAINSCRSTLQFTWSCVRRAA
ncbi:MAG TPA: hypothetical protein PL143_13955 [Rhodocyclaceae bacterium]|nr:hypothetical protein [Rhodocyclaceae bacterium]